MEETNDITGKVVRGPGGKFVSTNPGGPARHRKARKPKAGDSNSASSPGLGNGTGEIIESTGSIDRSVEAISRKRGRPRKGTSPAVTEAIARTGTANPTDIDPSIDPGFPTGSIEQLAADIAASEVPDSTPFTVAQPAEPKRGRGRPRKDASAQASQTLKRMSDAETITLVAVVLEMMNGAINVVAPFAVMTQDERELIEPPLARILSRMSPAATKVLMEWADPATVIMGLGLWAFRVRSDIVKMRDIAPSPKPKPAVKQQVVEVPVAEEKPRSTARGSEPPTVSPAIANVLGNSIV